MKERPILFSGEMVQAILDGRKTQTRRVVRPQPPCGCAYVINGCQDHALCFQESTGYHGANSVWVPPTGKSRDHRLPCPFGHPEDRLWVKETFTANEPPSGFIYRADGNLHRNTFRWKPSIFMPRLASRITLEITAVRVERLQQISIDDSKAEGVMPDYAHKCADLGYPHDSRKLYEMLWDRINGKTHPWVSNPWVWAIEFKRI